LAGVKFPQASCHDLERRVRIWRGSIQTHITCSFLILPSPKRLVWLAAAGSMFTIAHELGLIAGLTAVFTAILAVLSVLGDSAIALGMRALRWVRHSVLLSCTPQSCKQEAVALERVPANSLVATAQFGQCSRTLLFFAARRRCRMRFARSSSCRRVADRPLPARLMKY
jgi:hypothetical protein